MLDDKLIFYHCRIVRNDFIDIVFNKRNADFQKIKISDVPESKEGHIDLYWDLDAFGTRNRRQESLPVLITMGKDEIRDFLAWTSTYFPGITPLTSYVNVSDSQTFSSVNISHGGVIDENLWNALIGMTLCEVYISDSARNVVFSPDIHKCEMTFSYLLSKALLLGYDHKALAALYDEWKTFSSFSGAAFANLRFDDYSSILYFLSKTLREKNPSMKSRQENNSLFPSCQNPGLNFECFSQYIDNLLKSSEELSTIGKATKEERYSTMNKFYHSSFDRFEDSKFKDILLAYLVNMISPGTLQHLDFFHGKNVQKSIWLYYGAFAGMTGKTKIRDIHDSIGRRLYRDMNARTRFIDIPICDISSHEARIIFEFPDDIVHLFKKRVIKIQFSPGIESDFVFPLRQKVDESGAARNFNESDPKKIITNMIKELYNLNSIIGKNPNGGSGKSSGTRGKSKKRKEPVEDQNP